MNKKINTEKGGMILSIVIMIAIIAVLVISFFAGASETGEGISASAEGTNFEGFTGDTVQEKVWWALIDEGYTEVQVAGVMGNIYAESRFDPTAVNKDSGAIGLCQWLDSRKQRLIDYAKSKKVDWTDVETQIEFLIAELTPGGKGIADYQLCMDDSWLRSTTVEGATEDFYNGFERGGPNQYGGTTRPDEAKEYYNKFYNATRPSSSSSGSTGKANEVLSNTPGIKGTYTSGCSGKKYTEYYQNIVGSKWYNTEGCFLCSKATIFTGFGIKVTPNDVTTMDSDFTNNNLKSSRSAVSADEFRNVIKNKKGAVMCHIPSGGTFTTDNGSHKFNGAYGHWVAALDYKKENGKEKIYIHDPWQGEACYGWGDINTIVNALSDCIYIWKE